LLALRFSPPDIPKTRPLASSLEIILVNARHDKAPRKADALAQANLEGGGQADAGRAKSPLPNMQQSMDGNHLETQRRRIAELEQQQNRLLTQLSTLSRDKVRAADKDFRQRSERPPVAEMVDSIALARREAEIARNVADYNKRPLKTQLTPNTREVAYALYYTALQRQIEKTGTRYFPQQDGKKIYGELIVYIPVYQDGSLYDKEGGPRVERSSGNPMLDRAALAIVQRAAPFGHFPKSTTADGKTHVWEIITRFKFTRDDVLETGPGNAQ
jgi:protein TonB